MHIPRLLCIIPNNSVILHNNRSFCIIPIKVGECNKYHEVRYFHRLFYIITIRFWGVLFQSDKSVRVTIANRINLCINYGVTEP